MSLLVAFSLGLLSTLHCWGMCGGIVTALSISINTEKKSTATRRSIILVALNTGRIISYSIAGLLAGLLSQQISSLLPYDTGHFIMKIAAGIILVLIGLHLAGWVPHIRKIESFGNYVWKFIQPLGRRFIPVNTAGRAMIMGMIWGWLPCALVYSVLLWAVTSGNVLDGILIMFSFGLGTLPSMYTAGLAGTGIFNMAKHQELRKVAGIVIMIVGLVSPFISIDHHHQHDASGDYQHHH